MPVDSPQRYAQIDFCSTGILWRFPCCLLLRRTPFKVSGSTPWNVRFVEPLTLEHLKSFFSNPSPIHDTEVPFTENNFSNQADGQLGSSDRPKRFERNWVS